MRRLALLCLALLLPQPAPAAQDVVNTRHNLSTSGPGPIKSTSIDQVCVFCHTPHNGTPDAPLWNRQMSTGQTYLPYTSSTAQAGGGVPTGKSKLCLACHDGTVALSAMVNPPTGVTIQPTDPILQNLSQLGARGNLGTDLRDDHPISFLFTSALPNPELTTPPAALPLENGEVQCTTCHDPHEATLVPFLREDTIGTAATYLCTSCHDRKSPTLAWEWSTSSHATSAATPSGSDPWANRRANWQTFTTVAEGACLNCHTPHNAATPPRLLKNQEENTCFLCHDGTVTTHVPARNIQADFAKTSSHPTLPTPNPDHDATRREDPLTMAFHAECMDCHNPHGVKDDPPMISFNPLDLGAPTSTPPLANARIKGVTGIDVNGTVKAEVDFQYELCFKCHGLGPAPCDGQRCATTQSHSHVRVEVRADNTRTVVLTNIRDKVNPATPGLQSYHPLVENNQANNDGSNPRGIEGVPSLRQDLPLKINDVDALIYCTDCHNSDVSPAAGGTGASGPHGSIWEGLLAQQYTFNTDPANNAAFYALCYKCHDQGRLLSDLSGFPHQNHIQARGGACIICHDPHGAFGTAQNNARLINFLWQADGIFVADCLRQRGGGTPPCRTLADDPDPAGPIWIDDTGAGNDDRGECFLNCHNATHDNKNY